MWLSICMVNLELSKRQGRFLMVFWRGIWSCGSLMVSCNSSIAVNQMMLKRSFSSLPTVHLKQLTIQTQPITKCILFHNGSQYFPLGDRLRPSSLSSGSTQLLDNPYFTQSWCSSTLRHSAKKGLLFQGKQVHAVTMKLGYCNLLSLQNQILNLYVKCKEPLDACLLFDKMYVRNVVTWNTLIHGLVDCRGNLGSISYPGFYYFRRMLVEGVWPDYITYLSLVKMCIELGDIEIGKMLHCRVVKSGWGEDCFVSSGIVDLYGKFGFVKEARRVCDSIVEKDLVLWNVMVSCYVLNRLGVEGFGVYGLMMVKGITGDGFTYASLLSLCASMAYRDLGKQLHGHVIRLCFDWDLVVASAVIDMYAKNESVVDARKVFNWMVSRNAISWTTMIVGYGQYGDGKEAAKLFVEMLREGFRPDELTIASVVSSCGNYAFIAETEELHAYALKQGFSAFLSVANALINAYSKCGSISCAFQRFTSIKNPDLVSYTSMIGAYAFHGLSTEAIDLFEEVLLNGVTPDGIVFLEVLAACSHGGLVNEGLHYFISMIYEHQIVPSSEHYSCLIDLLSRAGLLDEAFNVLNLMSTEPGSDTLGAFFGACKIHGNVELATWAAEQLLILEPNKSVNYTLLSNMYASDGRWVDVGMVRTMMRDRCYWKVPGSSWIEISGKVVTFMSSDKSHPQVPDLYAVLRSVIKHMKEKEFASVWGMDEA